MGEVIQFPTSRIVRRAPPVPKLTELEEKDMQISKFVEELTEQLSMTILAMCQENVVHMKGEPFLRDLAVVVESLKSLLYRDFGKKHPMQKFTDTLTQIISLKNGQRITDINYSKLSTNPPQAKHFADVEKQGIALADKAGIGEEYRKVVEQLKEYVKKLPAKKGQKVIIRFEPEMDVDK
jgi:hypothetical protein|tara:strand:+ start:73 stop:612 length:540 start_codon:yes stop_codon:yes gene_type:complete